MNKVLAIITLILIIITCGCGFAIHFGGKEFEGAVKGHMLLGVLTLLMALVLVVFVIFHKK
jgi:uncharacterized membrane protein YdjX (TVP38/TMEM64 family)